MSRPEETPIFTTTTYAPLDQERVNGHDDSTNISGYGCFRRFCCFGFDDNGDGNNYLLQGGVQKEKWIVVKFKEFKEFSELVAGPKWKNFIRKVGKICNPKKSKQQTVQFQYSPESYALNFAGDQYEEEDDVLLHSFSTRFAAGGLVNDQEKRTGSL